MQEQNEDSGEPSRSGSIITSFFSFFPDLISYLALRLRQIFIWSSLVIEFFIIVATNAKREVVKRMFWGRDSFYRKSFHFMIIVVTLMTFLNGVAVRIANASKDDSSGLSVTDGEIGSQDIMQQYANVKSITLRTGDELQFDLYEHVVVKGETLDSIAKDYGLSNPQPIVWANGLDPYSKKIAPGTKLYIPPMDGVLKQAKKDDTVEKLMKGVKDADLQEILEINDVKDAKEILPEGKFIFIPNAVIVFPKPGPKGNVNDPIYIDPINSGRNIPAGTFINPLSDPSCAGYTVSRGYRASHTGVDLAKSDGCWIVAAAPGVVTKAAWGESRIGFVVVIKHDNGFSTLYGHGSGVYAVKEGDTVQAGQKIMYMGRSGSLATGVHLHLSLAANGNDVFGQYYARIDPKGIIPY